MTTARLHPSRLKSGLADQDREDLEGKTLGGAANDGALKLFPAFAKLAKLDTSKITIHELPANLREQMLMRGQADGVFGYVNTIRFSAKLSGIDPDKELRWVNYGDYGMDLYSTRSSSRRSS